MNKPFRLILEKVSYLVEKMAVHDMKVWPPISMPLYYQPERPVERESKDMTL